jgi:hypothetical protein
MIPIEDKIIKLIMIIKHLKEDKEQDNITNNIEIQVERGNNKIKNICKECMQLITSK